MVCPIRFLITSAHPVSARWVYFCHAAPRHIRRRRTVAMLHPIPPPPRGWALPCLQLGAFEEPVLDVTAGAVPQRFVRRWVSLQEFGRWQSVFCEPTQKALFAFVHSADRARPAACQTSLQDPLPSPETAPASGRTSETACTCSLSSSQRRPPSCAMPRTTSIHAGRLTVLVTNKLSLRDL